MGRLGCKCGKVLSNVDCPSDVELWGFDGTVIKKLLQDNPSIILTDAVMDYNIHEYYFWYCNDCGRAYVFKTNQQKCCRIYLQQSYTGSSSLADILQMKELYFFTDRQVEEPSETDFSFTLKAFLETPPHPYKFFITPDGHTVYAVNIITSSVDHCYSVETNFDEDE